MNIEVLYFRGCPNYRPALERLQLVLQQERLSAKVSEIEVKDEVHGKALKFVGSPAIRINGLDVEVNSRTAEEPAFACRRYADGSPDWETIRSALREAQRAMNRV